MCAYEYDIEGLIVVLIDVPFAVMIINLDGTFAKAWYFSQAGSTITN